MNRRERILKALTENSGLEGLDALALSGLTGIGRANISRELNELTREGKLVKLTGRPVKYFLHGMEPQRLAEPDKKGKSFSFITGEEGPLAVQVKQAKAAILYPPRGLHTLLIGQTGVGKTTFAERMYAYAVHMKVISEKSGFVSFNCAEYAENPQLLLSQLFGYVKGAFTGADQEKRGLVDKAEGGILFLDEIHRLPPEGQEIMFHLIDKGTYRKLGETESTHKGNVLIIGATTEDPEEALLSTFMRRIPMVIKLPSLEELPAFMRLKLIENFFRAEQQNIGVPIRVEKEILLALLLYECKGNIGQLKADIQLLCARGFLDYKMSEAKQVYISTTKLQAYIERGLLRRNKIKDEVIDFIEHSIENIFCYEGAQKPEHEEGIYTEISQRYAHYVEKGRDSQEIRENLEYGLEAYIEKLRQQYNVDREQRSSDTGENLNKILEPEAARPIKEILQFIEIKLERPISPKLKTGFAMHVNALVERLERGIPIENRNLDNIAGQYPKEYRLAKIIGFMLEEEFHIKIPEEEVGFLTLFLLKEDEKSDGPRIGVVVIAHGKYTATGMAEFANQLLGADHCRAIDMPLESPVDEILEAAVEEVKKADQGKGVVLLVDMGSLRNFGDIISHRNRQRVICIDMVSTLTVIEAVRKTTMSDINLDTLASHLRMVPFYTSQMYIKNENGSEGMYTIIATCISGQGSAKKIGEIVMKAVPKEIRPSVSVQYMNLTDAGTGVSLVKQKNIQNLTAVVGTIDLELPGVPYIPADELLTQNGINRLRMLLGLAAEEGQKDSSNLGREVLVNTLRGLLSFLDAEKVIDLIEESLEQLTDSLGLAITEKTEIGYVVHTACMIERNLKNEALPYRYLEEKKQSRTALFEILKNILAPIEEMWSKEIPDTEIAYLVEIVENIPRMEAGIDED